jgi:DNA-binding winged helix-turn-helix (wHTH) protein/tetratricopeptide (TPR) repeat protein
MDRVDPASAGIRETGYRFGPFRLESDGTLWRGGAQVPLEAGEMAVLRRLVVRSGEVVSVGELEGALKSQQPATSLTLLTCIAALREHLGTSMPIVAVSKRGYRFMAAVEPLGDEFSRLPRLAILPFANGPGVAEFLGPALAEELAARLSPLRPAVVSSPATDSIRALTTTGTGFERIGALVKADFVLVGHVRWAGFQYRLRAEMFRAEDGAQIWVEERLAERSGWLQMAIELARVVSFRLGQPASVHTVPVDGDEGREDSVVKRQAYEIFARARYEWQSLERHRMQDARSELLRAIGMDPELIAARVSLAHLSIAQTLYGFMPPAAGAELVRRSAGEALMENLDREALLPALGWISFHSDRNLAQALSLFRRSANVPYDPWIARTRIRFALGRHRFGEAIDLVQAAMGEDPCSACLEAELVWTRHLAGDGPASIEGAHRVLERFAGHIEAELYSAMILAFHGECPRAIEVAERLAERLPYLDPAAAVYAYALAMSGAGDRARSILERLEWLGKERYSMKAFVPAVHVALGDPDRALQVLEQTERERCPWFFEMLADPRLKSLDERPEFQSMRQILAGMEAAAVREAEGA